MHYVHVQRFQGSSNVLQFVNKCEAMFCTGRVKIFKCRLIKGLLEANFAPSVKPTIGVPKQ